MTLRAQARTIEAARELAVPTIRSILRKRRNAIRHRKPDVLAELNADLGAVVSAALALGVDGGVLVAKTTQHPDDTRVLEAVVIRESLEAL